MVSETKTSVLEQVLIKLMVSNPVNGDRHCYICGLISDADDRVPEHHEADCLLVQARIAAPALLEALKLLYGLITAGDLIEARGIRWWTRDSEMASIRAAIALAEAQP